MGRAPLHTVAEQVHISVMHQLGSSLHMISRYVIKTRSDIRSYLNNPLYYGKKKSTGRPRKVTSRDERNIIRVVSNSPKSLNDIRAELNLSVSHLGQLEYEVLRGRNSQFSIFIHCDMTAVEDEVTLDLTSIRVGNEIRVLHPDVDSPDLLAPVDTPMNAQTKLEQLLKNAIVDPYDSDEQIRQYENQWKLLKKERNGEGKCDTHPRWSRDILCSMAEPYQIKEVLTCARREKAVLHRNKGVLEDDIPLSEWDLMMNDSDGNPSELELSDEERNSIIAAVEKRCSKKALKTRRMYIQQMKSHLFKKESERSAAGIANSSKLLNEDVRQFLKSMDPKNKQDQMELTPHEEKLLEDQHAKHRETIRKRREKRRLIAINKPKFLAKLNIVDGYVSGNDTEASAVIEDLLSDDDSDLNDRNVRFVKNNEVPCFGDTDGVTSIEETNNVSTFSEDGRKKDGFFSNLFSFRL
uniref:HTH_Tnp_Tc3_1 domain-containing protein n=1 Tax=Caenorhabditis japonica TaxID=281687 RepID=A0A8R1IJC8_CAEJA